MFARSANGKGELEILQLELPSGALTRLGARARDRLINVRGDTLIFLENGHIVTQRAGAPPDAPAAAPIELPTRVSR